MDFCGNLINSISKRVILYHMWPRFGAKIVQNLAKYLLGIKSKKLILELWSLFLDRFWAAFSYFFCVFNLGNIKQHLDMNKGEP